MDSEPSQNVAPFAWNKAKEQAAELLAEDELTDDEIAERIGKARRTLWTWKKHPEFAARVREYAERFGAAACRVAIAKKGRRVRWLNDRVERMHTVVRERAADPSMQEVPGGATGLLVRTMKGVGAGPAAQVVEEYAVDTALLRELREHEKQAAQELGQWVDRSVVDLNKLADEVESMTDEELREVLRKRAGGTGEGAAGAGGSEAAGAGGGDSGD